MNTDTKHVESIPVGLGDFLFGGLADQPPHEDDPIPQDSKARKAWLDEAWAERERNGLE